MVCAMLQLSAFQKMKPRALASCINDLKENGGGGGGGGGLQPSSYIPCIQGDLLIFRGGGK